MEKEVYGEPNKIKVCDKCGEKAVTKCYFCGADLCVDCMAWVQFVDKEILRGKTFIFYYNKPLCKEELPSRRDCE